MNEKSAITAKKPDEPKGTEIGGLTDLAYGFTDGFILKPYNATLGKILPSLAIDVEYNRNSIAAQVGNFGGTVADIMVLSKVAGAGVNKSLGMAAERGFISRGLAESQILNSSLAMGSTGAFHGGVLTDGTPAERLKNATIGLATFGTMGATTAGLNKYEFFGKAGNRTLMQNVKFGALSGAPAGVVDSQVTSLVNGRGLNLNPIDVGKSALLYSAFGATMNGSAYALGKAGTRANMWITDAFRSKGTTGGVFSESASLRPAAATEAQAGKIEVRPSTEIRPPAEAQVPSPKPKTFDIPKDGMIQLGDMLRKTPAADQVALIEAVLKSRPQVPIGSWMRLVEKADMETFLKGLHRVDPQHSLNTAKYLIDRGMIHQKPGTQPIDLPAWEEAIRKVLAEVRPSV